jgi:uncharacterized protein YacL
MKKFFKFYKWELNNELYASIYFAGMLSVFSILSLVHGERAVDIFIMLEMLISSYIVSLLQSFIFNSTRIYNRITLIKRTLIWHVLSTLVVVSFSLAFHWFNSMNTREMITFILAMISCFFLVWLGIQIANEKDTKELNHLLNRYQENNKKREDKDYE